MKQLNSSKKVNYLSEYGEKLIDHDHRITPIKHGEKYPKGIAEWQKKSLNKKGVLNLAKKGYTGVGIFCGKVIAIDIDILDESIAEQLKNHCLLTFGDAPARVGQAPKILLPYRTNKPFKKITSSVYVDAFGQEHRIEVLGKGQQFVGYGWHPTTGKPYYYPQTELADIPLKELTLITEQQAKNFIDHFESVMDKKSDFKRINSNNKPSQAQNHSATQGYTNEAIESFKEEMRDHGLFCNDDIITDGEIHRFHNQCDRNGTQNCWYAYRNCGQPNASFGCHKQGITESWTYEATCLESEFSSFESELEIKKRKASQRIAKFNQKSAHLKAADKANQIWANCTDDTKDNPYLKRKWVNAYGVKQKSNSNDLIIPLRDIDGTLWSYIKIEPDGSKRLLKGGKKKGCFHLIGSITDKVIFAEGYATAAAIHMVTGQAVVMVGDCGNLLPVIPIFQKRLKSVQFYIAADDDYTKNEERNSGIDFAKKAAHRYKAGLIVPTFANGVRRKCDFNDVYIEDGIDQIKTLFKEICDEK